MKTTSILSDRLFCGVFPCGLSWADRKVEEHGDYKKLAFLPYDTLKLEVYTKHKGLRILIEAAAAKIIAAKGQTFQTAGNTSVVLGSKA